MPRDEYQELRIHTPYITARMMWAVDSITGKSWCRWRSVAADTFALSVRLDDVEASHLQDMLNDLATTCRNLEADRRARKVPSLYPSGGEEIIGTFGRRKPTGNTPFHPHLDEPPTERPTTMRDPQHHTLPYVNAIDEWIAKTPGLTELIERDHDVAGEEAHHFWTLSYPQRPGIQLFIAVYWIGGEHTTTTIDVRYIEDSEPIELAGSATLFGLSPRITARTVLNCVDSFHTHGHI